MDQNILYLVGGIILLVIVSVVLFYLFRKTNMAIQNDVSNEYKCGDIDYSYLQELITNRECEPKCVAENGKTNLFFYCKTPYNQWISDKMTSCGENFILSHIEDVSKCKKLIQCVGEDGINTGQVVCDKDECIKIKKCPTLTSPSIRMSGLSI